MDEDLKLTKGLKCRECGEQYPEGPLHICELCFGPLEVSYDYEKIKNCIKKEKIENREPNMWRYKELLPLYMDNCPSFSIPVGFTPLIKAKNLGKKIGVKELYIKNDSVNYPTLSFKDRVVVVAIAVAQKLGFKTVACASTGNLANSVAAISAMMGMKSYVFIPTGLERGKIVGTSIYGAEIIEVKGNYDEVNRLCSEIVENSQWAFVNINIRPYYAEGSKTMGYEIVEQLGWRFPANVVVPMAGGSLITKIWKSFKELQMLKLAEGLNTKLFGAQASGSAPISTAVKQKSELIRPVKPHTIAKSLAIGNPADGYYAVKCITESGGYAEDVSDEDIVRAIKLLAETEGIFTETAGGVTIATTIKLLKENKINPDELTVLCITGNGLKTHEVVSGTSGSIKVINPTIEEFEEVIKHNKCESAS